MTDVRPTRPVAGPIAVPVPAAPDTNTTPPRALLVLRAPAAVRTAVLDQVVLNQSGAPEDSHKLAVSLQLELKRVGCYDAEPTGIWGPASKKAMGDFLSGMNATLPFDVPDLILLTIVRGHAAQACRGPCPEGQTLTKAGTKSERCWPDAIVALAMREGHARLAVKSGDTPRPAAELTASVAPPPREPHVRLALNRSGDDARPSHHHHAAVQRPAAAAPKRLQVAASRPVQTAALKSAERRARPERIAQAAVQSKANVASWRETMYANRSGGG